MQCTTEHISIETDDYTHTNAAWPLGIRTGSTPTSGCGTRSVHSDGTACASYCGAFQNLKFPSSVVVERQRMHFCGWSRQNKHKQRIRFTGSMLKSTEIGHLRPAISSTSEATHFRSGCRTQTFTTSKLEPQPDSEVMCGRNVYD